VKNSPRFFCTYFDHNYLSRGIAMFRSLKEHCPGAKLWVLSLSDECYRAATMLGWDDLIPIRLEDFEQGDDALKQAKTNRSRIEYYFTCTPSLLLHVFRTNPAVETLTYVDADLFFYRSPEPIFEEIGSYSVAIIAHRFPERHRWMEQNGIFNVGWLTFRRDEQGLACLQWWRDRCIEWCHDYIDGDRFADQKYLDRFPKLFSSVKIIEHKGANLASWNLENYRLIARQERIYVDDQPLIFFHFHGIRKIAPGIVDPSLAYYKLRLSWFLESRIFRPYIGKLREAGSLAAPSLKAAAIAGLERKVHPGSKVSAFRKLRTWVRAYSGLLTRRFLLSRGE